MLYYKLDTKGCIGMDWNTKYPKDTRPEPAEIENYIGSPLWRGLCGYIETTFTAKPVIEHSTCSGAPGWNIKYRKNGRPLCTLYPHEGYFTALVCIGGREQTEAELSLAHSCPYLQELYRKSKPLNGSRWLMADVTCEAVLEGTKLLVSARAKGSR